MSRGCPLRNALQPLATVSSVDADAAFVAHFPPPIAKS